MPRDPEPTLAHSPSPFLRHGAGQPVAWLPWSEAAFERARLEDRPILLDIGAVWCHWCHVMDRESYDDPETARLINENFVAVKVDRDERPDVDARYQMAVQVISGQGGWPLTAFLTPDGEVFYGGTYFPPDDRFGRPAFRRVLNEIRRVWDEERERAVRIAASLRTRLSALDQADSESGEVDGTLVERAVQAFGELYDPTYGGFGGAPKFLNAGALNLLLDEYLDTGDEQFAHMVTETLTAMGRGGVHDQLGGGFHRYAVDAQWIIPHFEKMSSDNGVLMESYAIAHAVLGETYHREVVERIVAYYEEIAPELNESGGFPASQDADVGEDDGDYWTWTLEEVRSALGGEEPLIEAATLRYGLTDPASAMHSDPERHVLFLAAEVSDVAHKLEVSEDEAESLLAQVERRLKAARDQRPRPFVDETLYAGWVGLVASGHIAAARYLGHEEAGAAALRALDHVWEAAFDVEDGVAHRVMPPVGTAAEEADVPHPAAGDGLDPGAYLEDQTYIARALLDAYEWTQQPEYRERARSIIDIILRRFRDPESGAFTDRAPDEPGALGLLSDPHLPIADSPSPAGNAVAAGILLRLAALGFGETYTESAHAALRAFAASADRMPTAVATYIHALAWATRPVSTLVVVGDRGEAETEALLRTAISTYRPRTVVRHFPAGEIEPEELPEALRAMVTGDAPLAYLCAGQTCAAPTREPTELASLMRTFRG